MGVAAKLIRTLNDVTGSTSLVVSHDVPECMAISDYVILMATGGYGRQELAPFSDIDVMFFARDRSNSEKAERLLYALWDCGLEQYEDPGETVAGAELKQVLRALGLPAYRELRSSEYWSKRLGIPLQRMSEILTSAGYKEGFYYRPRIDRELLAEVQGCLDRLFQNQM